MSKYPLPPSSLPFWRRLWDAAFAATFILGFFACLFLVMFCWTYLLHIHYYGTFITITLGVIWLGIAAAYYKDHP